MQTSEQPNRKAAATAGDLFADLPASLPGELVEVLAQSPHVRIERIVSTGQASPEDHWYDQDESEWVIVLTGEAAVWFEGQAQPRRLRPGQYLLIPPHCRHRVAWTTADQPTVWLAVFFR